MIQSTIKIRNIQFHDVIIEKVNDHKKLLLKFSYQLHTPQNISDIMIIITKYKYVLVLKKRNILIISIIYEKEEQSQSLQCCNMR